MLPQRLAAAVVATAVAHHLASLDRGPQDCSTVLTHIRCCRRCNYTVLTKRSPSFLRVDVCEQRT